MLPKIARKGQALPARRQSEAQGYAGLASAARPERDDGLAPVDELTTGEFHG